MEPNSLLQILHLAERLKNTSRHCWTSSGRRESVAEHSWRLCLMAMLVRDEFPQADMDKVLQMCVIHDLGEMLTGDVPCFEKTDAHEQAEAEALQHWTAQLPPPYNTQFAALYAEMDALQTVEAKLYKALDNLEAVIQHNESDIATWLPLEYDLQLTYGADKVTFSPWLQQLKAAIDAETRAKIEAAQPE